MAKDMEPNKQTEDRPDSQEPGAGEAQPTQSSGLRKKPILPPKLEQVMDDIAPDQGKEAISGPVAKMTRRLQVLEKALADLTQQHERSVKDRVRALGASEESITNLLKRFDARERDEDREFANVRSSLGRLEERIRACEEREYTQQASPPPPADDANEPVAEAPAPEPFANPENVPSENTAASAAAEPPAQPGEPEKQEDYLTTARRAALAVAVNDPPSKAVTRQKHSRMRILAVAILAPIAILGAGLVMVSRNASTANPVAADAPPADRSQVAQAAALAEAPTQRQVAPQAPSSAPKRSLAILKTAIDAGDVTAMRDMGLKYLSGDEVDSSDVEAARWLIRAAYRNEAEGQYWLATLYAQGRGVPKDTAQAIHWYETAAKQGHVRAMHNLAVAHYEGWNKEKNLAEAAKWFEAASEHGNTDSAFNLAVLYELGTGVPQDTVKAFTWYAIAAAAGDAEAAKRIEILVPQLSKEDLDSASAAATAFKPRG
jgi:TPR repeat protein